MLKALRTLALTLTRSPLRPSTVSANVAGAWPLGAYSSLQHGTADQFVLLPSPDVSVNNFAAVSQRNQKSVDGQPAGELGGGPDPAADTRADTPAPGVVVDSDAIDFVAFSSNPHFAGVVSLLFVVMAVGFLECAVGLSPKVGGMDGVEGRVPRGRGHHRNKFPS